MVKAPTDLEILDATYNRYYGAFSLLSDKEPARDSKIFVPIDCKAIAKDLGTDRNWTNKYATGVIAIHAGGGYDGFDDYPKSKRRPRPKDLVFEAIIGVVEVVDVVTSHRSVWFEGKYGWVLLTTLLVSRYR